MSNTARKLEIRESIESKAESELRFPRKAVLRNIMDDLAEGLPVSDFRFDSIYPENIRRVSEIHWTPVDVARRAAELLNVGPKTRVLDIGSGAGKFCLVAALTSKGTFTGVEQRPHLVQVARKLARHYAIPHVSFIHARMEEIDWERFTGFYLYNPFVERLYEAEERIDDHVQYDQQSYIQQVRFVQLKLPTLPVGIRIVTYHGFGGEMAPGYEVRLRERWGDDYLVLWERTS